MLSLKTTWIQLCTAGTQNLPDNSFQKKISLGVNKLSLNIILINATIGVAASIMTHNVGLFMGVLLEIGLTSIPIYLNHRGRYEGAALTLYLIISLATFFFCCLLGKLAEVDLMIVVLIASARFIFLNRRMRIVAYGIAILVLVAVQLNQTVVVIQPIVVGNIMRYFLFWLAYIVVLFLVITIFNWYGKINDSLREWADRENKNKDKLIANATHEIKVSFRSIFAIIGILCKIEKRNDFKDFTDAVHDLRAACKNTSNIIDNVFEYERYNAGRKPVLRDQMVDIRLTLQTIVEIYRHFASEKNVVVEIMISDAVPFHIVCDEMKLRQIVTNLLHNAIKFTNNDTTVNVNVTLWQRQLAISVRDCGEGITDDIKGRMFEPFVSQNPDGLGLGLYIVKELVAALKGSIDVFNNASGGATLTVSWPLPGLEAYHVPAMTMQ
jgi:signal transduction histidine kinase